MLGASVIYPTLVLRSKSVAGPGAHREKYVGDWPNVAMPQKDSEGEFTAHLLSIMTNERHLCGLVQHELVGGCRYCAPCSLIDVDVVTKCSMFPCLIYIADPLLTCCPTTTSERGSRPV